jgi:hypothetical protein
MGLLSQKHKKNQGLYWLVLRSDRRDRHWARNYPPASRKGRQSWTMDADSLARLAAYNAAQNLRWWARFWAERFRAANHATTP